VRGLGASGGAVAAHNRSLEVSVDNGEEDDDASDDVPEMRF
jgi:hypothetical protein